MEAIIIKVEKRNGKVDVAKRIVQFDSSAMFRGKPDEPENLLEVHTDLSVDALLAIKGVEGVGLFSGTFMSAQEFADQVPELPF